MVRIQCSVLEQVRKNPTLFGQLLASDSLKKGGTHGMLAYWQDVSLKVHKGDIDIVRGIRELQRTFMNFEETPKNLKKQDFLQDCFVKYHKQFSKRGFSFFDSKRRMAWNITSSGLLTGLTPWVVKDASKYFSYFFIEQPSDWETELKFPLIQQYLAENNIECDITEINVGVYCLSNNTFTFMNYSKKVLRNAIDETISIFEQVNKEYKKVKSTS